MEYLSPPGFFPYLVLALWVLGALAVFATLPAARATFVVMLTGALFLPERAAFDGPLIPPLGKHELTALVALVGNVMFGAGRMRRARLGRGMDVLLLLMLISSAITVVLNPDRIVTGAVVRPGLSNYDIVSTVVREFLRVGIVFLLGRVAFAGSADLTTFWRVLLKFGLVYSFLMLLEIRLSPQLHRWIYGYHAHSFAQTIRWGGYRPTVLMEHGLAVGVFALAILTAVCIQARVRRSMFYLPPWVVVLYFAAVFVLCKSTGAIALSLVVVPVALFAAPRRQLLFASLLALTCALYPASKIADVFPRDALVELAIDLTNEDRAQSMDDRFYNDEMLLERARERLWFGWGDFGRNRVFDETGRDLSVTDGYWIILLGVRGVVGLTLAFTILLWPVFLAWRAVKRIPGRNERMLLGGLSVIHMVYVFDLLPNGLYNTLPFFFAGGLARLAQELPREAPASASPSVAPSVAPPAEVRS